MKELKELKKWFILIIFAILSYWLVNNFNVITDLVMKIINVLFPFILLISSLSNEKSFCEKSVSPQ